jgi:hypothetical protein
MSKSEAHIQKEVFHFSKILDTHEATSPHPHLKSQMKF